MFFCTPPSLGFLTVQCFHPSPRLNSSVGEATLGTEIPLLGVFQDILKDEECQSFELQGPCVYLTSILYHPCASKRRCVVGGLLFVLPSRGLASLFLPWSHSLSAPSSFAGYR